MKELEGSKLTHEDPVLLALSIALDKEKFLNFLSCKFIVNLSELPLISSDAPIVLYNQLMERSGLYIGATGLNSKGLQIFYPIHPRLTICLYDPEVYSCGDMDGDCISFESIEDANQLNMLQYINSQDQIFLEILLQRTTLCT